MLARHALRYTRARLVAPDRLIDAVRELAQAVWSLAAAHDDPQRRGRGARHARAAPPAHAREAFEQEPDLALTEIISQVRSAAVDVMRAAEVIAGVPHPADELPTEEMLALAAPGAAPESRRARLARDGPGVARVQQGVDVVVAQALARGAQLRHEVAAPRRRVDGAEDAERQRAGAQDAQAGQGEGERRVLAGGVVHDQAVGADLVDAGDAQRAVVVADDARARGRGRSGSAGRRRG